MVGQNKLRNKSLTQFGWVVSSLLECGGRTAGADKAERPGQVLLPKDFGTPPGKRVVALLIEFPVSCRLIPIVFSGLLGESPLWR